MIILAILLVAFIFQVAVLVFNFYYGRNVAVANLLSACLILLSVIIVFLRGNF